MVHPPSTYRARLISFYIRVFHCWKVSSLSQTAHGHVMYGTWDHVSTAGERERERSRNLIPYNTFQPHHSNHYITFYAPYNQSPSHLQETVKPSLFPPYSPCGGAIKEVTILKAPELCYIAYAKTILQINFRTLLKDYNHVQ